MTLPAIGTRIRYTGDMANASGLGYVVRQLTGDRYAQPGVDVALDDGRYFRRITSADLSRGLGGRWEILAGEPCAHPDECDRRIAEEDRTQATRAEARRIKDEAEKELEAKGRAYLVAIGQDQAKAIIVAEKREDESDLMSDYFASRAARIVVLAFSKHTRDLFAEMRKAAAASAIPAVRELAETGEEHREKYSMGHGYYLAGRRGHYAGWNVRKVARYGDSFDRSTLIALGQLAEQVEAAQRAGG